MKRAAAREWRRRERGRGLGEVDSGHITVRQGLGGRGVGDGDIDLPNSEKRPCNDFSFKIWSFSIGTWPGFAGQQQFQTIGFNLIVRR